MFRVICTITVSLVLFAFDLAWWQDVILHAVLHEAIRYLVCGRSE